LLLDGRRIIASHSNHVSPASIVLALVVALLPSMMDGDDCENTLLIVDAGLKNQSIHQSISRT
jgi:hypothetical protein